MGSHPVADPLLTLYERPLLLAQERVRVECARTLATPYRPRSRPISSAFVRGCVPATRAV